MTVEERSDYLIIGSGIAGLRAAVALAPHGRTVVLTKAGASAGSTGYAQGGIAAALGPDDSPALHAADTLAAGDGLCDPAAVATLVEEGPVYVRELMAWGAAFDRTPDGAPDLAREGAHSVRRVLHASDATGREIARTLAKRLEGRGSVVVRPHAMVVQLVSRDGRIDGARYLDADGRLREVRARATLIATGGAGQVYRETTNPEVATGDGVTLAWLAGARVADLEFVQFHPTALAVPGVPRFLLSEALRGEGARLVGADAAPFMARYDPLGDLAPRDRVSRAIVTESARSGGPVYLSLRHLPAHLVHERFPHVASLCRQAGLDLATDLLPVGPAAHYLMGGVATDRDGRTSLPGLFAAGEAACTGVHGANRLASNSLLEGLVFGGRAGAAMRRWRQSDTDDWPEATPVLEALAPTGRATSPATGPTTRPVPGTAAAPARVDPEVVRDLMWRDVGVFRDGVRLAAAVSRLDEVWRQVEHDLAGGAGLDADTWRATTLVAVARLIARAALRREESRGGHSRTDFPARDDLHWNRHATDIRA